MSLSAGVGENESILPYLNLFRALSVDSLNGGSTDALKKGPVEKKMVEKIKLSYLRFY